MVTKQANHGASSWQPAVREGGCSVSTKQPLEVSAVKASLIRCERTTILATVKNLERGTTGTLSEQIRSISS